MAPPNLGAMRAVADRLDRLGLEYAFVGGSIVNLLLDYPELAPVRPTDDVDVIIETAEVEGHRRGRVNCPRDGGTTNLPPFLWWSSGSWGIIARPRGARQAHYASRHRWWNIWSQPFQCAFARIHTYLSEIKRFSPVVAVMYCQFDGPTIAQTRVPTCFATPRNRYVCIFVSGHVGGEAGHRGIARLSRRAFFMHVGPWARHP